MDTNFAEQTKVINVMPPKDLSSSSLTAEWIAMKAGTKATFFISLGVLNASASAMAVTLDVANDASGTKSSGSVSSQDVSLAHYYKGGASPSDTFTKTTVSSSTWTIAHDDDGRILMVEVDAADMGTFTSSSTTYNAEYLKLAIVDPSAAALVSVMCIVTGSRYKSASPPTAIT